ncbi:uncharacterized protein LOC130975060 [Arachis stenosperma]|uniref:uncharacterized protein LOC130975060 n=1 Tax=Arachis stenosperma TaxID=217475 RepID=UPI0025ABAF2F|nr:uncharacterized protein LOC130975060 [Arachis stenosperma]
MTWEDVVNKFLVRFYPPQRVNRLRAEVQTFRQQDGGSLNKKKTIEEAIYIIETVANNEFFYVSDRNNNRGVIEVNHMDALLAQNKMITKQLADLTKQMERNQVVAITTPPPAQEGVNTEEGGDWEQANYVRNSSRQSHDPYSKTYNPGICKEVQDNRVFKDEVRANIKNQRDTIKRLESQVGYLSQQIPKPTDGFPSDTEKNPRGETKKVRWEECKVITVRDEESLEVVNKPSEHSQGVPNEKQEERDQETSSIQGQDPKEKEVLNLYAPKAPFPQRLRGGSKEKSYSRFLDIFASLHVNIPFIEALQQMPSYIKCMKELLTKKNPLKGGQTIVMNKECSALIQKDLPTKKKDPGSFHIPCAIGETIIDRGLSDLGASINLMPLSLMKKLQINELTPTYVIL